MYSTRRTKRRGASALAATATALALALAGCGADSDTAPPDGDPSADRSLTIAVQSGPNSLDPAQLIDGQQTFVWSGVLDTLLARDPETGELIPNAAERWEYNEDGTLLTLTLRDGMTFSDGTPVDADAVVASMERTRETPGPVQSKYSQVTDVTAVDPSTVEVHFDSFDPTFLSNIALGAGAIGHPDTLDDERTATDPVGSGPFELDVANTVPDNTYVLKKREDYWNADAIPVSTFTVRVMPDPTAQLNALQAGEIDAGTVQQRMLGQLDESAFTLSQIEANVVFVLEILDRAGETWPALGDVRVRQALNYAIDREAFVEGLLGGLGSPTVQIFNPQGEVYDPALEELYEYDPERGRELVEEAGYVGESFEIPSTFLSTAFEPTISQAFSDVGLNLEWVSVPPQQVQSAHMSGDYGLSFQVAGFNSDPSDAFSHFVPGGFSNPQNHSDPTLDELFGVINTTVDYEDAIPTYREVNAYAVEQAFEVPIAFGGTTWAARDGITYSTVGGLPPTIRAFGFE
ncbi:ABC transporter substrate-binding protein [Phytoactinopolyspora halotolerans]|uniref:ABC transporter substrate-binding protein n=1 Tax=Phytoactinopolyspora halotolerans TaxID=1981512 RepID=A0A6L9SIQ3_9ACTN|nr:ABC transporter substrate-binding protein [Phytoactinopolyspora halotolerans]NEE04558.1 ABC transporter substrate-binding protein [Phytoactinopolyspora halotolerans]